MNIRTLILASLVFATGSHLTQAAKRIDPWYLKGTNFAKSVIQNNNPLAFPYEQKLMHDLSPLKEMVWNGASESKVFKLIQSYAKGIADTIQKVNIDTYLLEKQLVSDYKPIITLVKSTILQACTIIARSKNVDEVYAKLASWKNNLARLQTKFVGR